MPFQIKLFDKYIVDIICGLWNTEAILYDTHTTIQSTSVFYNTE